jgi:hypothetical protein
VASYPTGVERVDVALNSMVRSADEFHFAAKVLGRATRAFWAALVELHKAAWEHRERAREKEGP